MSAHRLFVFVACLLALLADATGAQSEAEESCTVSILNRTARVRADGTWIVPNVQSNMGPVRARMTCVRDGETVSGTSELFTIVPDRMNAIPAIPLGDAAPTPAAVRLSAPRTLLTSPGQTLQLAVTAIYPDGRSAEVTPAASGTVYQSTDATVAEVDADGRVTAVASGRVLISALHEAVLDALVLTVLLGDDSDGDGMPDDFEAANGLDPQNPVDGLEDPDRDALSNLEEFDRGTRVERPDTDGDRIADGEEVVAGADGFVTDPLRADSDGDGVPDGLEIRMGTDPVDPASVDLTAALETIEVIPGDFVLVFNTVLGEGSRRLRVIGRFVDGTVLELTAARGVSYRSSDLAVASFGAEPGRVFAGQDGGATVTAEIGGQSAGATVTVESFSPTPLGRLRLPAPADAVAVTGDHAFLAATTAGLLVVDVADPRAPRHAGTLDTPGIARDVRVWNGLALVADVAGGLRVIDVIDPTAPAELASLALPGARDLAVAGGRVYVVDGAGLRVVDLADPASPALVGGVTTPGTALGVAVEDGWALVADAAAGVHVVDVREPSQPRIVGTTATRASGASRAADLAVRGRRAWVADGSNFTLGGLRTIDWSDPASPFLAGSTGNRFGLVDVALEREFALTADYFFVNAVPIFNTGPRAPVYVAPLDFARFGDDNGRGVAVRGGVVFMVGVRRGVGSLFIGRYAIFGDDAGRPPTVGLTAPADGAVARERSLLSLAASARDDVHVAAVDFLVDGEVVATDYAAPYSLRYPVPAGAERLRLEAIARDLGGNRALAAARSVTVVPDENPTAAVTSPAAGSEATAGGRLTVTVRATDDVAVASVDVLVDGAVAATRGAAPYRFEVPVPASAAELAVAARATDNVGNTADSEPLTVTVIPDGPPAVDVVEPSDGERALVGSTFDVLAGATDDLGVEEVEISVDGEIRASDREAPYELVLALPTEPAELEIVARARDSSGHVTSSAPVRLAVVDDPGVPMGEVGRIADLTHVAQTIVLERYYDRPVVFARPLTQLGGDTALVRVTEVLPDRFTLYVHEAPDRGDLRHTEEVVDYVVLEAGSWRLFNGARLEVGTISTAATVGIHVPDQWADVAFVSAFDEDPVVLTQVQTNHDPSWVGLRQTAITTAGLRVALEEEEASRMPHGEEVVGWLAMTPGSGTWSTVRYRAKRTLRGVTNRWYRATLDIDLGSAPRRLIAVLGSYYGNNSAHLRYRNLGRTTVELRVEDDTTFDRETDHINEVVHLLVLGGDGILTAEHR